MKRLARRRRAPWVVLALGIAALAAAAAVAVAGLQPANLSYTPNSESQVTNIDVARAWIKNYYGSPGAGTGPGGAWGASLNPDSNYANEARSVAKQGENWLAARSKVPHRAIVLDVDDTTLTTWNYELFSNWDYNPSTNAYFVGLGNPPELPTTFTGNMFPATPGMLDMVNQAKALRYAIFFITGRGDSQHDATIANLVNDKAAYGLNSTDITSVTYLGSNPPTTSITVPEVDANYPMPTPLDTGHGGFTDGLFTKPAVLDYPEYLHDACSADVAAGHSCSTIHYKSATRAYIESQGYDIVANFGDQFSDLEGGYADKTFKMPNPNYYLP